MQLLGFHESYLDLSSGLRCVIIDKHSIITFISDMLNLVSWLVNMGSESQLQILDKDIFLHIDIWIQI